MKLEYQLKAKKEIIVDEDTSSFEIEGSEVFLEVNEEQILSSVKIVFLELEIKFTKLIEEKRIDLYAYEEKRFLAYKILSYISNRILYETNNDVFDVNEILKADPNIYPETAKESEIFRKHKTIHQSIFTFLQSIQQRVSIENYQNEYGLEKVYTAYADGIRANSVITRYVQFYKAMEALLGDKMKDKDASGIVEKHNLKFNESRIAELRVLRNRCEHPHQAKGHISTSDIRDIKEVEQNLPDLTRVVKILFDHFKDQTEHKEITSEREN